MLNEIKTLIRGSINIKKLKKEGLIIGKNFDVQQGVIIDPGHCWLIEIGDNVTLAPNCHILSHDASMKKFLGYTKIANTKIGNNVFIGAGTIILPGVTIEDDVIVGAGSVVTKNLASNSIYAGNPAKKICNLCDFLDKHINDCKNGILYDANYKIGVITEDKKQQMKSDLAKKNGYII